MPEMPASGSARRIVRVALAAIPFVLLLTLLYQGGAFARQTGSWISPDEELRAELYSRPFFPGSGILVLRRHADGVRLAHRTVLLHGQTRNAVWRDRSFTLDSPEFTLEIPPSKTAGSGRLDLTNKTATTIWLWIWNFTCIFLWLGVLALLWFSGRFSARPKIIWSLLSCVCICFGSHFPVAENGLHWENRLLIIPVGLLLTLLILRPRCRREIPETGEF